MPRQFIHTILFDTSESHPSDQVFEPGRLRVLAGEDGRFRTIAIERGRELALFTLYGEDATKIATALGAIAAAGAPRIHRLEFQKLKGGAYLKLSRDNRGDPWSQGVTLRFGQAAEGEYPVFDGPHFYLEDREIDGFLAALTAPVS